MASYTRPVVVGVDGSPASDRAVDWAADAARSRGVPLRMLSAYQWELRSPWEEYYGINPPELTEMRASAERTVVEALARVRSRIPDAAVTVAVHEGDPVDVLLSEPENTSLLVVGSRQLDRIGAGVFGSVAANTVARATCPTVVVRASEHESVDTGPVLVGVDGRPGTDQLLSFAFAEAEAHGSAVHAVFCRRPELLSALRAGHPTPSADEAESWLAGAVARWRNEFPNVGLQTSVIDDHPIGGLVTTSRGHRVVVVGRRHHVHGDLAFGTVTRGVLHHARIPVAVVPLVNG